MSATTISNEEYVQECKEIAATFLLAVENAERQDRSIVTPAVNAMGETIEHSRMTNCYVSAAMVMLYTQNPNAGMGAAVHHLKEDKDPQALDMICFLAKYAMKADILDCINFVSNYPTSRERFGSVSELVGNWDR